MHFLCAMHLPWDCLMEFHLNTIWSVNRELYNVRWNHKQILKMRFVRQSYKSIHVYGRVQFQSKYLLSSFDDISFLLIINGKWNIKKISSNAKRFNVFDVIKYVSDDMGHVGSVILNQLKEVRWHFYSLTSPIPDVCTRIDE